MKRIATLVIVLLVLVGPVLVRGGETESQARIFTLAKKSLGSNWYVRMQNVFPNLVQDWGRNLLVYAGIEYKFSDKLSLALMAGKMFEEEDNHTATLVLETRPGKKWLICTQVDWQINKESMWRITQVRHLLGNVFWVGIENDMVSFGEKENNYFSIGPNAGIVFSKNFLVSLTYFRKWTHEKS
ncbi:MAG: hypothetical protein KAU24_01560, partial [Candidatus Aenigmarchaeota archaeon]|nr:hypothetical protein [Candidatus Aenigmarchaeota archaeon]